MLENSMTHSLMQALKKINLQHPLATSVAAALLRPMEVFTRPMVVDKMQEMLDKENVKASIEGGERTSKLNKTSDSNMKSPGGPSQHSESAFADDEMLEDGFDLDTAERTSRRREPIGYRYEQMVVDEDDFEEDVNSFSADEEISRSQSSDDDEHDDIDESGSDESDDESDDESSDNGDDSSDEEASDDQSMLESQVDLNEDSESIIEDIEEEHDEVLDDGDDFEEAEEEHDDFFEGNIGTEQDDEADGNNSMEEEAEEWTNVEMLGLRNNGRSIGRPRSGRFVLEAAEHVLGNILRTNDIQMETIAEIENTLGIRISHRSEYQQNRYVNPQSQNRVNRTQGVGSDPLDEVPRVNQVALEQGNWGSSVGINNRHFNFYSMGNFFEGSALGTDRSYFDVTGITSERDQSNSFDVYPIPSTFDTQLFPGGPAASTHSRMPTALHPLLSSITLPPVNALVSVRALQEDRARGFGLSSHGVLTNLRGSAIRQYRSPINIFERLPSSPQGNREVSNWTADGQPLTRTSTDFSRGFEQVLGSVIAYSASPSHDDHNQQNSPSNQIASTPAENGDEDMDVDEVETDNTTDQRISQRMREEQEGDVQEVASTLTQGLTLVNRNQEIPSTSGTSATPTEESDNNRERDVDPGIASNAEVDNSIMAVELEATEEHPSESPNVETNTNGLSCPPGMDVEVFSQLPLEMQQEIADQHQATQAMAAQLDSSSGLDPETLAALPEDVRREVIEQDQRERRLREQEQAPADPSNAQEMDNASFIASLAPGLREEVLMSAEEDFLNSLPPDIIAEAHLLQERASSTFQRRGGDASRVLHDNNPSSSNNNPVRGNSSKRKSKSGKLRVDCDRTVITFDALHRDSNGSQLITASSSKYLLRLMYLLSPVRPTKLLQKLFQNLCRHPQLRKAYLSVFVALLDNDPYSANRHLDGIDRSFNLSTNKNDEEFPPSTLIGTAPDILDDARNQSNFSSFGRTDTNNAPASIATNLPVSGKGAVLNGGAPPVVARRLIQMLNFLSKTPSRVAIDLLNNLDQDDSMPTGRPNDSPTCFETLLGLLESPIYTQSSSSLDDILSLLESLCAPLSSISDESDNDNDAGKTDNEPAVPHGKELIDIPKTTVSPEKLKLLCSTLRLESCKNTSIQKVHTVIKRLCKVKKNRAFILSELASVSQALASNAVHDLRFLSIRLGNAVDVNKNEDLIDHTVKKEIDETESNDMHSSHITNRAPSSVVTLFASSSEWRLLRVLQTLYSLVGEAFEDSSKARGKDVNAIHIQHLTFDSLWEQLSSCLKKVSILEGVTSEKDANDKNRNNNRRDEEQNSIKLQSNMAGLLPRFLPSIEAFFVVNANYTTENASDTSMKVVNFVTENKILLNALLRSNPSLLDKGGLKAMVQFPQCRPFLDFDVKRQWFKTQVRKIRTRRYNSLKLTIQRSNVFEDAYHQLRLRNAEEMRGRLHVTFSNEEGVDAGGLSREFFGILAKEMFNPNYALFITSQESMYTFQPNPQSRINPDHLEYFRFVGRIVGKAIVDGYLLDAVRVTSFFFFLLYGTLIILPLSF